MTTNELRSNGIWILGCSNLVSSHIYKCTKCRKFRRGMEQQRMSDLPVDRTEATPPFTFCGMDCFGLFYIKERRKELKRYRVLLTCMCSRAIHIEMLDDLTSDAFINTLRSFIAIRGAVRQIKCDQGTNFVGARWDFVEALREMDQEEPKERGCEFIFNTPTSSHLGGVWERQIRTIRSVLMSILEQSAKQLDSSSLRTFLYEVMAVVNSRPLTTDNLNDSCSPEPLTPKHVLTMKSTIISPPPWEVCQGRPVPPEEMASSSTSGQQLLVTLEEGVSLKSPTQTKRTKDHSVPLFHSQSINWSYWLLLICYMIMFKVMFMCSIYLSHKSF